MAFNKKFPKASAPPPAPSAPAPRLVSKIVHDERGTARVEWQEAPEDYRRTVLEVEDPLAVTHSSKVRGGLEILNIEATGRFNPYERGVPARKPAVKKPSDLRKLSAWIKMMRELEERKKEGGGEDEE